MGGMPLPIAQATCRGPAFTLRRVAMAQNDSGEPTLLNCATAQEQSRAAGCLQRISLPGRRVQRRPECGKVNVLSVRLGDTVIFFGAPPAYRSRIPQNPVSHSSQSGLGHRPVGGHPADHPPLLPAAAGLWVAGFPKKRSEEVGAATGHRTNGESAKE